MSFNIASHDENCVPTAIDLMYTHKHTLAEYHLPYNTRPMCDIHTVLTEYSTVIDLHPIIPIPIHCDMYKHKRSTYPLLIDLHTYMYMYIYAYIVTFTYVQSETGLIPTKHASHSTSNSPLCHIAPVIRHSTPPYHCHNRADQTHMDLY